MPINIPKPKHPPSKDLLGHLRRAFEAGDVLAVLQASKHASEHNLPVPKWVSEPLDGLLIQVLQKKKGKPGKGNSPYGQWEKMLVRTVRASAYRYAQAWGKDPHRHPDLPRPIIESWCHGWIKWPPANYLDALRLANDGLKGTLYQAQSQTIRKAAEKFPEPVSWRRREVEEAVGLRGENGIFGLPPDHDLHGDIDAVLDAISST